jgi:hypothetical protein
MKIHHVGLMLLICVAASLQIAEAEEVKPTAKQEMLKELVVLMGAEQLFQQMLDTSMGVMQQRLTESVRESIAKKGLGEKQRDAELAESNAFIEYYVARIRELIPLRVHAGAFFQQMVVFYDKYFSEEDIAIMLDYQRTPTAQKALRLIPQMMQESIHAFHQSLGPQMADLATEALEDTKRRFKELPIEIN